MLHSLKKNVYCCFQQTFHTDMIWYDTTQNTMITISIPKFKPHEPPFFSAPPLPACEHIPCGFCQAWSEAAAACPALRWRQEAGRLPLVHIVMHLLLHLLLHLNPLTHPPVWCCWTFFQLFSLTLGSEYFWPHWAVSNKQWRPPGADLCVCNTTHSYLSPFIPSWSSSEVGTICNQQMPTFASKLSTTKLFSHQQLQQRGRKFERKIKAYESLFRDASNKKKGRPGQFSVLWFSVEFLLRIVIWASSSLFLKLRYLQYIYAYI